MTKWNDDRGFGFLQPASGTEELFVHISAFPQDSVRPRVGELVSFEIDVRSDGKQRAVRVMRPGRSAAVRRPHRARARSTRQSLFAVVASALAIAAIAWYGYTELHKRSSTSPSQAASALQSPATSPVQTFSCDGRTRCSKMHSCAEATFFINHCPGTTMDGDRDGIPCESQWCPGG